MKDMGLHIVDMLDWLAQHKAEPLRIVECGTIRDPRTSGHEDGLSTLHIADWVSKHGGEFYSFEIEAGRLRECREFLKCHSTLGHTLDSFVTFGLGDAGQLLQHFNLPIDLCYLDAGADVHQNLEQFRYAQKLIRKPGFVVIDDVFDPRNADRGLLTMPIARLEGFKTAEVAKRLGLIAFGDARNYRAEDVRWIS